MADPNEESVHWFPLHCCFNESPPCGECAYCLANGEIERLRARNVRLEDSLNHLLNAVRAKAAPDLLAGAVREAEATASSTEVPHE